MTDLKDLKNLDVSHLSTQEAKEFTILLEELEKRDHQEISTSTFLHFVKGIWHEFISGEHHKKMAKAFESGCKEILLRSCARPFEPRPWPSNVRDQRLSSDLP